MPNSIHFGRTMLLFNSRLLLELLVLWPVVALIVAIG